MKRRLMALFIVLTIIPASISAFADHPAGWWPIQVKYLEAEEQYANNPTEGNLNSFIKVALEREALYLAGERDADKAAVLRNIYADLYPIYESIGNYDLSIKYLEKYIEVCEYLEFDDAVKIGKNYLEKLTPFFNIYVQAQQSDNYPYYGAINEPKVGTYYGRVHTEDNEDSSDSESITSFYIELETENIVDFDWNIRPEAEKGKVIHIAWNVQQENDGLKRIANGEFDAKINNTVAYLKTLGVPVMLRIGGEMNVWEKLAEPELYKTAFKKIANVVHNNTDNVAMVFSPNLVSNWSVTIDDYYPGDEYVDWVGLSLYMNKYMSAVEEKELEDHQEAMYFLDEYAEPVIALKEIVGLYGDRKPIIITECGSGHKTAKGTDLYEFAAPRVKDFFGKINVVYPQIKAIIYFDVVRAGGYNYSVNTVTGGAIATTYLLATKNNASLIKRGEKDNYGFSLIDDFVGKCGNSLVLKEYAYTKNGTQQSIKYMFDGKLCDRVSDKCTISKEHLTEGSHTLEVFFDDGNGYNKIYKYSVNVFADATISITEAEDKIAAWALQEVNAAAVEELIPNFMRNGFNSNISRIDFCKLIMNMVCVKLDKSLEEIIIAYDIDVNTPAFTDTDVKEIIVANKLKIVNGRGGGIFDPTGSIARQEAAAMLQRAATLLGIEETGESGIEFKDSEQMADWAKLPIEFVSSVKDKVSGNAVMGGVGDNNFSPNGYYTKQQAILTMLRLYRCK